MNLDYSQDSYEGIIIKNAQKIYSPSKTFQHASLVIYDSLIQAIGTYDSIQQDFPVKDYLIINANDSIVIPGFIDPHSHPVFGGERSFELPLKTRGASYLEIQEKGGGINYTLQKTRKATKEELMQNLQGITREMLYHGTTVLEGKTGYHLTVEGELLALEVMNEVSKTQPIEIIPTFLGAHLVPPEYKDEPNSYVDLLIDEMLPKVKKQGIAKFTDVFCDQGAFTYEQSLRILEKSLELGIPVRVHADQFARLGLTPTASNNLHAVSIDHLLQSKKEDFESMIKNNVTPILIPADALVMFLGSIPYQQFKEYQQHLAIASDFNPNNWLVNMNLVLTYATYLWKIPPQQALISATKNAAKSLSLDKIGEIKVGNQADLLLYKLPDINHIPYHHGLIHPWIIMKKGEVVKGRNTL